MSTQHFRRSVSRRLRRAVPFMKAVETPWLKVTELSTTDSQSTSTHSLRIQVSVDHEQPWCFCGDSQYLVCSGDALAMLAGEEKVQRRTAKFASG